MGMAPTTNNWVKDGLDAYLSLTGEHRAEKKSEQDLAHQQQGMQLAVNADQRAQASSELAVDEGKRKAEDRDRSTKALRDLVHKVNLSDPGIPNANDPANIEQSRQAAVGLANLAGQLDQLPDGYAQEWKPTDIPPEFQKFVDDEGLTKAAQRRAGKEFTDPVTGKTYMTTGNLSSYKVVKPQGKKAQIMPMLEAHDPADKAVVFEVPFTKRGTNEPDDEINMVTADMIMHKSGSRLSILNAAEQSGKSPVELKTDEDMKWLAALPYESQVAVAQHLATTMLDRKGKDREEADKLQRKIEQGTKASAELKKFNADNPNATAEEKRQAAVEILAKYPGQAKEYSEAADGAKAVSPEPKRKGIFTIKDNGMEITYKGDPEADRSTWEVVGKNKIASASADPLVRQLQLKQLTDAMELRRKAEAEYSAITGGSGSEYTDANGEKRKIAVGDTARALQRLQSADKDVQMLGGKGLTIQAPAQHEVSPTAKQLRTLMDAGVGLSGKTVSKEELAASYRRQGIANKYPAEQIERDIDYAMGKLDNGVVTDYYGMNQKGGTTRKQQTAAVTPPAGFKPSGKTVGGKPAYVSADGKKIWTP